MKRSATDWVLFALVAAGAVALKHHYSVASPGQLDWILAPTTFAVETVTGADFVREAGTGWLSRERMFVIAKSCAGVNFLIVALLASAWSFGATRPTLRGKLVLLAGCAAASYAATLVANTARIALAMHLHEAVEPSGWLTRARVHRVEGVLVYLVFLCLFYLAAQRALRRPSA